MTYKEIVDRIQDVCRAHDIIREFGYGAISDLKTLNTEANSNIYDDSAYLESQTLYPYVFLNPTQSTRSSQAVTYRFNMIVMDTVLESGLELLPNPQDVDQRDPPYGQVLQVQSDCEQYVDDIILDLAEKDEIIVATQDKALKLALKQKDIKVITLRQKKYLKIDQ